MKPGSRPTAHGALVPFIASSSVSRMRVQEGGAMQEGIVSSW